MEALSGRCWSRRRSCRLAPETRAPGNLQRNTRVMSLWTTYFQVAKPAQPDDVTPNLWNDEVTVKAYYAHDEKYQEAVMEQYKLYVEMTDRISSRRALANTFFLTLNSAVLTLVAVFWKDRPEGLSPWYLLPMLAL